MKLHPPTTETIKAKADRYYKAQCKRLNAEKKAARPLVKSASSRLPAQVIPTPLLANTQTARLVRAFLLPEGVIA